MHPALRVIREGYGLDRSPGKRLLINESTISKKPRGSSKLSAEENNLVWIKGVLNGIGIVT
ncbi:MAG: hypothetical protein DRH12_11830 [Deltaproteobacteria bacterium]|nr:MAG: hypothetical protein DRH12_11830 [Deltaproteobacteria bacterium]